MTMVLDLKSNIFQVHRLLYPKYLYTVVKKCQNVMQKIMKLEIYFFICYDEG